MIEPAPPETRRPTIGQVVLGLGLVLVGGAWLLAAVGGVDFRAGLLLPLLLMLVGGGLVAGARTGAHPGLIAAGLILTLLLAVASSLGGFGDVPFSGGIGTRVEQPVDLDGGQTYRLAIGELEVDLTGTPLPARVLPPELTASVAAGRLVVRLPAAAAVRVEASVAIGSIRALGEQAEGLDVDLAVEDPGEHAVVLDLSVGIGEVVVER